MHLHSQWHINCHQMIVYFIEHGESSNLRRSASDCQFSSANIADTLDVRLYLPYLKHAGPLGQCRDSITGRDARTAALF